MEVLEGKETAASDLQLSPGHLLIIPLVFGCGVWLPILRTLSSCWVTRNETGKRRRGGRGAAFSHPTSTFPCIHLLTSIDALFLKHHLTCVKLLRAEDHFVFSSSASQFVSIDKIGNVPHVLDAGSDQEAQLFTGAEGWFILHFVQLVYFVLLQDGDISNSIQRAHEICLDEQVLFSWKLLQQIDELVSGQSLEHGEVRQLWRVRPMGKSHGAGHLSCRWKEEEDLRSEKAGSSPGSTQDASSVGTSTDFQRAPDGALALQPHVGNEWRPLAQAAAASGDLV